MYLKKYFASLWKDWVAIMSGLASLILAFLVAFYITNSDSTTTRILLGITSAICLVISSYRIWENEHKKTLILENQIGELKEQNKPVLQLIQRQDEMSLEKHQLNNQYNEPQKLNR